MADFLFVSRYSISNADLTVVNGTGTVVDADANTVSVSYRNYLTDAVVFTRNATRIGTGVYRITLSSTETATPGAYYLRYSYSLGGVAQEYRTDVEVPTTSSPLYESLDDDVRSVIERVWMRFSDLFDSALGGPHLQMYAQANFGRERVAELCRVAVGRLNTVAQPYQTYDIVGAGVFPVAQWGALLEQATMVEVIKHLMRSYVEQPSPEAVPGARLDRRDYLQRWETMLRIEEATLASQLDVFKMSNMGLGQTSVLVAGGVYGNLTRSQNPARPRHRTPWAF